MSNVAINIQVQVIGQTYAFISGVFLEEEFLDHVVSLYLPC